MLLTKTLKQVTIGLIVMVVALITFAYPDHLQDFLNVVRGLQFTATVALLYGVLKKEPLHKDKFILFWLALTAFLFLSLVSSSFDYLVWCFSSYPPDKFYGSLPVLFAGWLAAAVVGISVLLIYQEYKELIHVYREAGANTINPKFQTMETPPPPQRI